MPFIKRIKLPATVLIAIFLFVGLLPVGPAVSSYPYERVASLSKGKFLVATRQIKDPRFTETVILLTGYGEYGAAGIIINRPTRADLSSILPNIEALKDWKDKIYFGGPVSGHNISFLIRSAGQPHGSVKVFKDVYVAGIKEALEHIRDEENDKVNVRAYIGSAGWAPTQLEKEVMRGDWLVSDGDAAVIFDKNHEGLWEYLYRKWSTMQVV